MSDIFEPIKEAEILTIAAKAVRLYAESHPRPSAVTQRQAAEMLCISEATAGRLVRGGWIKRNKLGLIPIAEIDRALAPT